MSSRAWSMPDKRLAFILPFAFALAFAIGIVSLGMLFIIKEAYGAGGAAVGGFTALWAAAYFLGCIAFRPLSSRIDAASSAALMAFLSAALLALQFAFPCLASAFVCFGLYGFATALAWPRVMGWLSSGLEGAALGKASGIYSLAWSSGMAIAPFVSGLLAERGLRLPIYVGIAIFAASGLFMLGARKIAPPPAALPSSPRADVEDGAASADRSTALRYPAWIGLFCAYLLYSVVTNIFPVYAKDELAMSESTIGLFILIRAAAMAAGFWLLGRLAFWQFKRPYLIIVLVAVAALALAFVFLKSAALFAVALVVFGLFQAFAYLLSIFYGASGAPDRDRRMSIHEAVLTAGQILGSVAGGAIYQSFSWSAVFAFVLAACLLCLPAQLSLAKKR
jgi:MFS family permease